MSCNSCRSIACPNNWCQPQQCCPPTIVIPQNTQFYNYQNCFNAPYYYPSPYANTPYYFQALYGSSCSPCYRYPNKCYSGWC